MQKVKVKTITITKAKKGIAFLSIVSLVLQMAMLGAFFPSVSSAATDGNLCEVDVDMVLVMDRSGSMAEGESDSICEWRQYDGQYCVNTTTFGLTENECADLSKPPCPGFTYTPATQSKMDASKQAANSFLSYFGGNDQSALVSFANDAALDKILSNNHPATQGAVDILFPLGATNIGGAIDLANQELGDNGRSHAVPVMVLLTDGRANKPYGSGVGENPADVAYALQEAGVAAGLNYKIFTIGLGDDINGEMLQSIADITGASYYPSPSQEDLEEIYNLISLEICGYEYGSISGCKYLDSDSDGSIAGEETLQGWEIILDDGENTPIIQLTGENGCYSFAGLLPGNYTVSEVSQDGWIQTYPAYPETPFYNKTIDWNSHLENMDFGNYLPFCGNNILDEGEGCDDGNTENGDGCSSVCQIEEVQEPICGNGEVEEGEECDDGNTEDGDGCSAICEIEEEQEDPVCGNGILEEGEGCDSGENNGQACSPLYGGDCSYCSNECQEITLTGPHCGDGIKNGNEECDGGNNCKSDCTLEDEDEGVVLGETTKKEEPPAKKQAAKEKQKGRVLGAEVETGLSLTLPILISFVSALILCFISARMKRNKCELRIREIVF